MALGDAKCHYLQYPRTYFYKWPLEDVVNAVYKEKTKELYSLFLLAALQETYVLTICRVPSLNGLKGIGIYNTHTHTHIHTHTYIHEDFHQITASSFYSHIRFPLVFHMRQRKLSPFYWIHTCLFSLLRCSHFYQWILAHGVMVIVVGNGHDDTSSNPGRDWLHFA